MQTLGSSGGRNIGGTLDVLELTGAISCGVVSSGVMSSGLSDPSHPINVINMINGVVTALDLQR